MHDLQSVSDQFELTKSMLAHQSSEPHMLSTPDAAEKCLKFGNCSDLDRRNVRPENPKRRSRGNHSEHVAT
jgi:hypothetical protein